MSSDRVERLKTITALEQVSRRLEFDPKDRENIRSEVVSYAEDFIDSLTEKPAYQRAGYDLPSFPEGSITESGHPVSSLIEYLDMHVHSAGINPASGGHMGFIPGGGVYGGAMGDYLAAVFNRYAGVYFAAPGAVKMENALIRWTGHLMGLSGSFAGNIASGGSIANLIAISTARIARNIKGRDYEKTVIYLSEQVHHCITKGLRVMGMDECTIRYIPLDKNFRMRSDLLEEQIIRDREDGLMPFMLIATAGTTDSGAIDPLERLGEIAQKEQLWYHVDAAYGGYFMLSEYGKEKMKGIHLADSIVVDPHKGLFLPFGSGIVLIRDGALLQKAQGFTATYMQDIRSFDQHLSPAEASPELTKHFRGLRMWLPLMLHGVEPFRACIEEKLELARYFYDEVKELGFETGPYPELSVVLFRYEKCDDPDETNREIARQILDKGDIFLSSTTIQGTFWLRIAILSFRTHIREIDNLLLQLKNLSENI